MLPPHGAISAVRIVVVLLRVSPVEGGCLFLFLPAFSLFLSHLL